MATLVKCKGLGVKNRYRGQLSECVVDASLEISVGNDEDTLLITRVK